MTSRGPRGWLSGRCHADTCFFFFSTDVASEGD